MLQSPALERLEQRLELHYRGADLSLIVSETGGLVIGYRVIVLPHIGQYAEKPFPFHALCRFEGTVVDGLEQSDEQPTVLFHITMEQVSRCQPVQFGVEVRGDEASRQRERQLLQFMLA